jgi:hypothetical protein
VNRTKERKRVQNAVVWDPCPTTLVFPETASEGLKLKGDMIMVWVVFWGVLGAVNGLAW